MTLVEFFEPLRTIFGFIGNIWFLWVPVVLFFVARTFWLEYRQGLYFLLEGDFVLLEIRSPREVEKSAKAMEQIFATVHSLRNGPGNAYEKYWDGEFPFWHSFEIVGSEGTVHFYVRTLRKYQRIIESQFHAHYPQAEIIEAEDYVDRLPKNLQGLYNEQYKIWGSELVLEKEDAYPIRTYLEFESQQEEQNLDPIGTLVELMGKLKPKEHLWVQILIRTAEKEWQEKGEKLVEALKEKQKVKSVNVQTGQEMEFSEMRTPGETEVMKAIERSIAKPGFETLIRYVYIAHESVYVTAIPQRGVIGAFRQFGSLAMNNFRQNFYVWTLVHWSYFPHLFARHRQEGRKKRIYQKYRDRAMPGVTIQEKLSEVSALSLASMKSSSYILTTEELATIFHLPTMIVTTAPSMRKVESRKVGPPVGLDIFKEE